MDVPNQKAFHVPVHSSLWNYSQSASRVFPSDFIITPFPAYSPGYVSFVPSLIRDCLWVSRYVIFLLTLCFLAEGFRTRCHCTGSHCSGQLPCGLVSAYLLLFWVLSHISQPLYLSLFCPDLPELAAHIGRLEFISEGFDLCKNPSVGQKIGDAPHSPVPSLSPVTLGKCLRVLRGTLRSLATGKLGPSLTPGAVPTRSIRELNERVSLCARSLCKHPRSHRLLVAFISSPNCATYRSYQVGHVNRNYIL